MEFVLMMERKFSNLRSAVKEETYRLERFGRLASRIVAFRSRPSWPVHRRWLPTRLCCHSRSKLFLRSGLLSWSSIVGNTGEIDEMRMRNVIKGNKRKLRNPPWRCSSIICCHPAEQRVSWRRQFPSSGWEASSVVLSPRSRQCWLNPTCLTSSPPPRCS